jgi:hypothetical protein
VLASFQGSLRLLKSQAHGGVIRGWPAAYKLVSLYVPDFGRMDELNWEVSTVDGVLVRILDGEKTLYGLVREPRFRPGND